MRHYFAIALIVLCVALFRVPDASATDGDQDKLREAIAVVRKIPSCVNSPTQLPDLKQQVLCETVGGIQHSINQDLNDNADQQVAEIVASSLYRFLFESANASPPLDRLSSLKQQIRDGDLRSLSGVSPIPPALCSALAVPHEYCQLPACLLPSSGSDSASRSECPQSPVPYDPKTLKAKIREWMEAQHLTPCAANADGFCLPVDGDQVAARVFMFSGGVSVLDQLPQILSEKDTRNAIAKIVSVEIECRSYRDLAIDLAGQLRNLGDSLPGVGIRATDLSEALKPFVGTSMDSQTVTDVHSCVSDKSLNLFRSVTQSLNQVTALSKLLSNPIEIAKPVLVPVTEACVNSVPSKTSDDHLDFLSKNSHTISGIRVRLKETAVNGRKQTRGELFLLVNDSSELSTSSSSVKPTSQCTERFREVDLHIQLADLQVSNGKISLPGLFGHDSYAVDDQQMGHVLQQFAAIPSLPAHVSNVVVPSEVFPLSFDLSFTLPGTGTTVPLGKVDLDSSHAEFGLSQLTTKEVFLSAVRRALSQVGELRITTGPLGGATISDFSIVSEKLYSENISYQVKVRNPLLNEITDGKGLDLVVDAVGDGTLHPRPVLLGSDIAERLQRLAAASIATIVASAIDLQKVKAETIVRIDKLLSDGADISFTLELAPPDQTPISIKLTLSGGDIAGQIQKQLLSNSNAITNLMKAYSAQLLKTWATRTFDASGLRDALLKGVTVFGENLRPTDIKTEGSYLSFSVTSDTQHFVIRDIRTTEFDGTIPKLDFSFATLESGFAQVFESQIGVGGYLNLRILQLVLKSNGSLTIHAQAQIPALIDSVPVEAEVSSSQRLDVRIPDIRKLLLQVVVTNANSFIIRELHDPHIVAGGMSLAFKGLVYDPSEDGKIGIDGEFTFGDLVTGSARVVIYPQLNVSINKGSIKLKMEQLTGVIHLPFSSEYAELSLIPDPLSVRVNIRLAQLFSQTGISLPSDFTLPEIPIQIMSNGEVRISEPISFQIMGEISIYPFSLANPTIELYPQHALMFGATGNLTLVQGTVKNLIKIKARLEGNLEKLVFTFEGPVFLFNTFEIMTMHGQLDIPHALLTGTSTSTIPIISAHDQITIDGLKCSLRQNIDLGLPSLGGAVSVRGALAVQLYGGNCQIVPHSCPPRGGGLGSICVNGSANLGPLGTVNGGADLSLAFAAPVVWANINDLTPFKINVEVRASSSYAKAAFGCLGLRFTVITPTLDGISASYLEQIIQNALKPTFDLQALARGDVTISFLPNSGGRGEDPSNGQTGNGDSGQDSANGQVGENNAGTEIPQTGSTSSQLNNSFEPHSDPQGTNSGANEIKSVAAGTTKQNAWIKGDWSVDFQEDPPGSKLYRRYWISSSGRKTALENWQINGATLKVLEDGAGFPYPAHLHAYKARGQAADGRSLFREYQLYFSLPNKDACASGVCVIRFGPEDNAVQSITSEAWLKKIADNTQGPAYEYFLKTRGTYLRPAQLAALRDIALSIWEPEEFGQIQSVDCFGSSTEGLCSRIVLNVVRSSKSLAIIHSAGLTWEISPDSMLWSLIKAPNPSQPLLDILDGRTSALVIHQDSDSFLYMYMIRSEGRKFNLGIMSKLDGSTNKPVVLQDFALLALAVGPNVKIPENSFSAQLHELLKETSGQGATEVTLDMRSDSTSHRAVYREEKQGGDGRLVLLTSVASNASCRRQATKSELTNALTVWSGRGDAPRDLLLSQDLLKEFGAILLLSRDDWRQTFAANPFLLLQPAVLPSNTCSK